jgi:hypothetical protein
MNARSGQILARFPAHLEAARPGKVLGDAVESVALDLDMLAARLAAVRRAHRLSDADELADLLLIAARHGITEGELELVVMRFARARKLLADLVKASDDAARNTAAEAVINLWSVAEAHPRLPLFAPSVAGGGTPDLDAAQARLILSATEALRYGQLTDAVRARVGRIASLNAAGNGTVQAVMAGAANALDLEIGPVTHSADRFWHAAPAFDRLRLSRPVPRLGNDGKPTGAEIPEPLGVAEELIGLEENPLWRDTTDSTGRRHGELFTLIRRGFERALLQIRITGEAKNRTTGPMFVNRDEGHGVGFTGTVPHGSTLVFTEEGRALLDGADVTSLAFAWRGGCFAETDAHSPFDFVFDGESRDSKKPPAHFVEMAPTTALDRKAVFPSAGESLPMPGIAIGLTRLAFFVQEAHLASLEGTLEAPVIRIVSPRVGAAFADGAVLAPGQEEARPVAAEVALSWLEHRAFSVRLLIPPRFRNLEEDVEGTEVRRRVALALERFRPVGIELRVEFIDDRWVLGQGVLASGEAADVIEQVKSATALWELPAESPSS